MGMILAPQLLASLGLYGIENAALFDGSTGFMSRTPASVGNQQTGTLSVWLSRHHTGTYDSILVWNTSEGVRIESSDNQALINGGAVSLQTSRLVRDTTAFEHLVVIFDSTQAIDSDRLQIWRNGVRDESFTISTYPARYSNFAAMNNTLITRLGSWNGSIQFFDGYMADLHWVDGFARDPSYFAKADPVTGNWIAKEYTGPYGTSGFHLDFANSASLFATVYSVGLTTGSGSSWPSYTIRTKYTETVLGSGSDAGFVRLSFDAENTGHTLNAVYIGKHDPSGDAWDFDGNQVPVLFNGSGSGSVPAYGTLVSDPIEFSVDGTSDYIVAVDYAADATHVSYKDTAASGVSCAYAAGASASQTAPMLTPTMNEFGISKIEFIDAEHIGVDASGNGNHWLPNGTITQVTSTPTNTVTTWNALTKTANVVLSDGNRIAAHSSNTVVGQIIGTFGSEKGKYYFEYEVTTGGTYPTIGVCDVSQNNGVVEGVGATNVYGSSTFFGYRPAGEKWTNGGATAYGSPWATGDTIQVALDLDNGAVWFGKNNVWQGGASLAEIVAGITTNAAYTGLNGRYGAGAFFGNNSEDVTLVADANDWMYTAPTGFKALTTDNLTKAFDGIDNHFKTVLYTGNGGANAVTGVGFRPGFVWYKSRSTPNQHGLSDGARDVPGYLVPNATDAEVRIAGIGIDSLDGDGFTLGSNATYNGSGNSYVAWCANLPLTKTSNWSGSPTITPTKEIYNPSTMFKMAVVSYTGNGTAGATLPHSLGVKPGMIIVKRTDAVQEWPVYHASLGATKNYEFDSSSGAFTYTNRWNDTEPTSTLITLGDGANVNASGSTYVAYIFAPCDGIKIGSYTNTNNVDGPYINAGIAPVWSLLKTNSSSSWYIHDASRPGYNPCSYLQSDTAQQEILDTRVDLTANGLKLRTANDPNYLTNTTYYILIGQPQGPSENPAR